MDESLRLSIRYAPIDALTPYLKNARTHSDAQVAQIAASIREFGWTNAILVDGERGIIAGHARAAAAKQLGMAEVPTIELAHLTPAQRKAYIIADNKLALNAGWNDDLLRHEFEELKALDYNLELTGFGTDELAALFADRTAGNTDPDDVPDLQPRLISQPGELWLLGRHRLLCGNSTLEDDVRRVMGEARADVVFTDPPYGVAYSGSSASGSIAGDITQTAIPISFKQAIDHATTPDARLYFCGGSSNVQMYYSLFDAYLRKMPAMIIWDKGSIVMRRNNYHSQYEVIFFGWKGSGGANECWFGSRTADVASDIWLVKRDNGQDYLHPTQKPTALAERAIGNSCPPGGAVYEPFSGSGSTLIAAEITGRTCHAVELAPQYVDVAVRRWQAFTGREATLASDGRSFAEVEASKGPQPQAAE